MNRIALLARSFLAPFAETGTDPSTGQQQKPLRLVTAAVVAALSLIVTVPWLKVVAPWADESATLMAIRRSWSQLWVMYQGVDAPLVPYYSVLKLTVGWLPVADQLAAARLISAIAIAGAAATVTLIGAKRLHLLAGLLGGAIFISLPGVTRFALEARPYALLMAFSGLAWLAFDRSAGVKRTVAYLGSAAAAIIFQAFAVFQLPAHTLLAVAERTSSWRKAALLPAAAVAVALPQLYLVATRASGPALELQLDEGTLPTTIVRLFSSRNDPRGLIVLGALILLSLLSLLGRIGLPQYRRLARLAWFWMAIPAAATLTAGLMESSLFRARYLTPALAPAALLAGIGLLVIAEGVLRVARGGVQRPLAGLAMVAVLATYLGLILPSAKFARSPGGHRIRIAKAITKVEGLLQAHPDAPVLVDSATQSLVFEVAKPGLLPRNPLYHYDVDLPRPWATQTKPIAPWNGDFVITATRLPELSRSARKGVRGYTRTSLEHLGSFWIATWERHG